MMNLYFNASRLLNPGVGGLFSMETGRDARQKIPKMTPKRYPELYKFLKA